MSDERVYYNSSTVYISNKIIKSGQRAFNPSMINTISFRQIPHPVSSKYANTITLSFLLVLPLLAVFVLAVVLTVASGYPRSGIFIAFVLLAVAVIIVYYMIRIAQAKRNLDPYGWIGFATSSGTVELISTEYDDAVTIQAALEQMIRDKNK